MHQKVTKPDSNEFRIQLKGNLSQLDKNSVIDAIKTSPKFSRYYQLQNNDWYQLREENNQDPHNPPEIEILLKENYLLVMRAVDKKPWWTNLDKLKTALENNIERVTVSVENYWD